MIQKAGQLVVARRTRGWQLLGLSACLSPRRRRFSLFWVVGVGRGIFRAGRWSAFIQVVKF